MKSRPILFQAPMVRAILAGHKTQTRRIVKLTDSGRVKSPGKSLNWHLDDPNAIRACPYGTIGDQLWIRETFADNAQSGIHPADSGWVYRATDPDWQTMEGWKWKPAIFMPRGASRITLRITGVRVQRLNEISALDCIAEGIEPHTRDAGLAQIKTFRDYLTGETDRAARQSYETLWQSINGPESWDANPYVWAITFEKLTDCEQ